MTILVIVLSVGERGWGGGVGGADLRFLRADPKFPTALHCSLVIILLSLDIVKSKYRCFSSRVGTGVGPVSRGGEGDSQRTLVSSIIQGDTWPSG